MATGTSYSASGKSDANRLILATYRRMLLFLLLGVSTVVGVLLVFIFVPYLRWVEGGRTGERPSTSIFLIVVLAGIIGAFFSSLQRLYNFTDMPAILYDKHFEKESSFLFVYSLVPALVGGISAAVLYLIFAAVLLSGSFFPGFGCHAAGATPADASQCASLTELFDSYAPNGATDYAKAILWGFVAGFAERLVPDLLGNFVQAAEKNTGAPAKPANNGTANFNRDPATWPDTAAAAEAIAHGDVQASPLASRAMANQTSSLPLINERG